MAAKAKNNAVEFWRIIFTFGVSYFHFNLMGMLLNEGKVPGVDFQPILTGGWVLGFFLFLTGYFMMAHYNRRADSIDSSKAHVYAWTYFWTRVKGLLPPLLLGTIFVFIVRNVAVGTPLVVIPTLLIRSLFEFFGLYQLGVTGMNDIASNADLVSFLANEGPSGFVAGMTSYSQNLWNGPGWYISAIIITSVVIYWVLCKNKDAYLGLFCPLIIIGAYGYMGLNGNMQWDETVTGFLMIPTKLIRVTAGICVGSLMWYVVQWIKEKEIAEKHALAWNALAVSFTVFMLFTLWNGVLWTENQNNFFLIVFTIIILVGQDVVNKALNNEFSAYCGRISLYWYVSHWGLVMLLPVLLPELDYLPLCGVYFVCCFVVSNVLMWLDNRLMKPLVAKASKEGDRKQVMVVFAAVFVLLLGSYVACQVVAPNAPAATQEAIEKFGVTVEKSDDSDDLSVILGQGASDENSSAESEKE